MKKKFLILGIIVTFMVMLVALTGCGNEKETSNSNKTVENEGSKQSEKIEFLHIKNSYSGEYAILDSGKKDERTQEEIYYYVDSAGKVVYERSIYNSEEEIFSNGYITVDPYRRDGTYNDNIGKSHIIDPEGKSIKSGKSNVAYSEVSKDGYILAVYEEDGLSGKTYNTKIESLQGKEIFSVEGKAEYKLITGNVFAIILKDESKVSNKVILIDAKSKEKYEYDYNLFTILDNVVSGENYIYIDNKIIRTDLKKAYDNMPVMKQDLNDKYYLGEQGIVNLEGKVVYDFSEGGYSQVYYYDGTYYVVSKTGFLYTMDDNFKRIAEPIKHSSLDLVLTTNGIATVEGGCGIIDKNLNKVQSIKLDEGESLNVEMSNEHLDQYIYIDKKNSSGSLSFPIKVYDVKNQKYINFYK